MDGFYYHGDIEFITEILKNRLYFGVLEKSESVELKSSLDTYYFCTDNEFVYLNFYHDFGPLNLSCLYKYCCKVNQLLNNTTNGIQRYVHYTANDENKRSNASYLIGCYSVLYLHMDPKEAYQRLYSAGGSFKPFVDASQGPSPYTISIMDCFRAVKKCETLNFFNFDDFSYEEYDNHDRLMNGDMNWLVPGKFLAFIGPTDLDSTSESFNGHPPVFYINFFLNNDIKTVIRLNNRVYNEVVFTKAGIQHYDLFFPDGTIPPKHILLKFLDIAEHAPGAIAVHCKAGLGRTGSLIGAYIVKHFRLSAREAIAWMRICRPGSVIGAQQDWLEKIEKWLWRQGNHYRSRHFGEGDKIPHHRYGVYSSKKLKEREMVNRMSIKEQRDVGFQKNENEKSTRKKKSVSGELSQNPSSIHSKMLVNKQSIDRKKKLLDQKEEELRRLSNLLYKVQTKQGTKRDDLQSRNRKNEMMTDSKRSNTGNFKRHEKDTNIPIDYIDPSKRKLSTARTNSNTLQNERGVYGKIPLSPFTSSLIKSDSRKYGNEISMSNKHISTQGDKLNNIKMKRFLETVSTNNTDKNKLRRDSSVMSSRMRNSRISSRNSKRSDFF